MLNKVIMMGRLCDDPDFKQTQSQIPVCRFRIAINRPKAKDGSDKADFINCVTWRSSAEFVSRYFSKGSMIVIEGRMQNNDYTDGNGVKHYSYEVLCENVSFGESKKAQEGAAAPQQQYQGYTEQQQQGYQPYGAAPAQYPKYQPQQGYQQPPYNGQPPMY